MTEAACCGPASMTPTCCPSARPRGSRWRVLGARSSRWRRRAEAFSRFLRPWLFYLLGRPFQGLFSPFWGGRQKGISGANNRFCLFAKPLRKCLSSHRTKSKSGSWDWWLRAGSVWLKWSPLTSRWLCSFWGVLLRAPENGISFCFWFLFKPANKGYPQKATDPVNSLPLFVQSTPRSSLLME